MERGKASGGEGELPLALEALKVHLHHPTARHRPLVCGTTAGTCFRGSPGHYIYTATRETQAAASTQFCTVGRTEM